MTSQGSVLAPESAKFLERAEGNQRFDDAKKFLEGSSGKAVGVGLVIGGIALGAAISATGIGAPIGSAVALGGIAAGLAVGQRAKRKERQTKKIEKEIHKPEWQKNLDKYFGEGWQGVAVGLGLTAAGAAALVALGPGILVAAGGAFATAAGGAMLGGVGLGYGIVSGVGAAAGAVSPMAAAGVGAGTLLMPIGMRHAWEAPGKKKISEQAKKELGK